VNPISRGRAPRPPGCATEWLAWRHRSPGPGQLVQRRMNAASVGYDASDRHRNGPKRAMAGGRRSSTWPSGLGRTVRTAVALACPVSTSLHTTQRCSTGRCPQAPIKTARRLRRYFRRGQRLYTRTMPRNRNSGYGDRANGGTTSSQIADIFIERIFRKQRGQFRRIVHGEI